MAGTILENLAVRKLIALVVGILICQVVCFLIGGLIAPAPSNVEMVLATKCVANTPLGVRQFDEEWHIPRDKNNEPINCRVLHDLNDPDISRNETVTTNHIVFAFQLPLPKRGFQLDYSRWMQNLIAVLHMDIVYKEHNPVAQNAILTIDVKLGFRDKNDPDDKWSLLANSTEERQLSCTINSKKKKEGYQYHCDLIPLFELGSLHFDYYLVNLRLPTDNDAVNTKIGQIEDIWLVVINQNGGFTKVWVSMKTAFLPIIVGIMVWYWRRITLLSRPPILLEQMILGLGICLTLLNLPLEYFTLAFDLPFMLLISDIRQGVFYAALLSFWLVFCGEHMMDDIDRRKLRHYWKHLSAVAISCTCLFLFDMCERGVKLRNPFYSIWVTDVGTKLALAFIILAGVSASLYFIFLCYMAYHVFRNIRFKRNALPSMSSTRRLFYEGIIYRFKFLMLATLLCAAMTVISYIVGQVSEGQWKWEDDVQVQYTSAFFTGVYGMWNLYVFALLVLYAPSHKAYPPPANPLVSSQEEIEFSRLTTSEPSPQEPTEVSSLTEFAKKAALD